MIIILPRGNDGLDENENSGRAKKCLRMNIFQK
jgi:hypothetical protein